MLIDRLPDNYTIEDYSLLLARKWHVGTNKNGLVYVAAIHDHKQRLEKASGLDSVFTQQKNLDILNSIKPSFKSKDYYGGLQILINQISTTLHVGAEPVQQQAQRQTQTPEQQKQENLIDDQNNGTSSIFLIIGGIFIVIIILVIISGNRRRRMNSPVNYNGNIDPNYVNSPSSGGGSFFMGAILGAVGLFTAQNIQDDLSNQQGYDGSNDNGDPGKQDSNDNDSSSWGNWGGGDSSSDSGFSSSDSDSGSSSDW